MASRDIRRISRKLRVLGKNITSAVEDELLAGADTIVAGQKRRAPKKTGRLAASIHHSGLVESKSAVTVTISAGGEPTTKSVDDWGGEEADYAVEQEFGNQHMAANPFFYPEVRAQEKKIRQKVRKAFRNEARK